MRWTDSLKRPDRVRWIVGVCVVLMLAAARPLFAANISGTWDISCRLGQDRQVITLELVQRGSRLSGVGTIRANDDAPIVRVEVQSGTASAGKFRFLLVEQADRARVAQELSGNWYRDEMSGKTTGAFGARMFAGVRRRTER